VNVFNPTTLLGPKTGLVKFFFNMTYPPNLAHHAVMLRPLFPNLAPAPLFTVAFQFVEVGDQPFRRYLAIHAKIPVVVTGVRNNKPLSNFLITPSFHLLPPFL